MFFSFFKTKRSRDPQLAKQLYDKFNKHQWDPFIIILQVLKMANLLFKNKSKSSTHL